MKSLIFFLCCISSAVIHSQNTAEEYDCGCGKSLPTVTSTKKPILSLQIDKDQKIHAHIYDLEHDKLKKTKNGDHKTAEIICRLLQKELERGVDLESIDENHTRAVGDWINQYLVSEKISLPQIHQCIDIEFIIEPHPQKPPKEALMY